MKRIMIIALGLVMSLGIMAQHETAKCDSALCNIKKERLSPEQKAKMITDRMAKAYDLTAEQAEKLLALNKAKLTRQWRKPHAQQHRADSLKRNANAPRHAGRKGMKAGFRYMKALKEILTPEQFKAFCMDRAIERQLMGQGRQAMHQPRQAHRGFRNPAHQPRPHRGSQHHQGAFHHMRAPQPQMCGQQPQNCGQQAQCAQPTQCKQAAQMPCEHMKKDCKKADKCQANQQCKKCAKKMKKMQKEMQKKQGKAQKQQKLIYR